jgi:TonB-dependent receptor
LILCIAGFFTANMAMAGAVRGTVQDSLTGLFLSDVRVSIVGLGEVSDVRRETVSRTGGKFSFGSLEPGSYTVIASYVGYPNLRETVEIKEVSTEVQVNLDFSSDEIVELEAFTVEGSLIGSAKALNRARAAQNLKNVVASDAIGQFVDRNAAEALSRLPGISVEDSQGEGKFVIIRGADPTLNSVSIDGVVAATPEEDGRSTSLDIISIDQLESIEVTKSWLPDKSANFIGGAVNLITRSALERGERFGAIGFAVGQHEIADDPSYRFSLNYGDVLLKGKNLGIQFSFDYSKDNRGSDTLRVDDYEADVGIDVQNPFPPNGFQLSGLRLEDFIVTRERTGFSGKVEYAFNENHSVYLSASLNEFDNDEVLQQTRQRVDLADSAYAGKTAFDIDVVNALGLDPNDPAVIARLALPPDERPVTFDEAVAMGDIAWNAEKLTYTRQHFTGDGSKSWSNRVIKDRIFTLQAGGKSRLADRFNLDYKVYTSDADKDWTDQGINMRTTATSTFSGIGEGNVPYFIEEGEKLDDPFYYRFNGPPNSNGGVNDNEFQSTDERSGAEVNLEVKYSFGELNWTTKVGAAFDVRDKSYRRFFQGYGDIQIEDGSNLLRLSDLNPMVLEGFLEDYGNFNFGPQFDNDSARNFIENTPSNVDLIATRGSVTSTVSNAILQDYDATEDISAGYLMQTLDWKGYTFIAGLRFEQTDNTFTNTAVNTRFETTDPQGNPREVFISPGFWKVVIDNGGEDLLFRTDTSERSYDNLLPAFHAIKRFGEDIIVRGAYTQTIARPTFTDLIPREIIGVSGVDFSPSVRLANFDLLPQEAENFDLGADYYFKKVGVVGINFFHKNLNGPIYTESRTIDPDTPLAMELFFNDTATTEIYTIEWITTRKANAGEGSLSGIELTFNRKLDFLPGFWNGFGFAFNTAFIDSEVALLLEERLNEKLPLFKQSDRLTNLSLYYEKYGFLARLSMQWKGGYLEQPEVGKNRINNISNPTQVGAEPGALDLYVDDFFRLDLRLEYRFQKWGTVFFEGTNLTGEPLTKYYGDRLRVAFYQDTQPIYFVGYKWTM